jgi:GDP-D-mannose 3',5'-epimerase
MNNSTRVLITGAGGFIGSHMEKFLKEKGYWVRAVDLVHSLYMDSLADEFLLLDLRRWENCLKATEGIDQVYSFACNMGGIGFIETVKAEVMHDNVLINAHLLEAARQNGMQRFFYSSSACVYPTYRQKDPDNPGLQEDECYPADPDNEYGWEKLYTERMCKQFTLEYGLETRVARYHNIFGPYGTWNGGREKAPAAICRKVALAEDGGTIEIWGDGRQTRSFLYIDECLEGTYRLMQSDYNDPVNIGSDEMVTIDQLADMAIEFSGKRISKRYDTTKPQGVRGRNSDNTRVKEVLGWAPAQSLRDGIGKTYPWIAGQVSGDDAEQKRDNRRSHG